METTRTLLHRCLTQVEGDTGLLEELLDMLPSCLEDLMASFRKAVVDHDATAAHEAAHSVKGMLANVGFFELAELAYEIEQLSKASRFSVALERMEELAEKTNATVTEVRKLLENMPCGC